MAKRLTPFSKLLLTIAIVAAIVFGGKWLLDNTEAGRDLQNQAENTETSSNESANNNGSSNTNTGAANAGNNNSGGSNDDVIKIGVVTWGGYAGGQYFNEGFKANKNSRFYKDYGFQVEFKVLDDFVPSREAWKRGDVDLLWATIDAFPTEAGALSQYQPEVVFQADWSRGGDAIVVQRGINSVADLRGKKIAVAELTPSHSFLLWLLEAGGLKPSDVKLSFFGSAIDAADAFKNQQVEAAVVWSPDDAACLDAVAGSRVLQSTKSASHIIADVFFAKKEYIDNNQKRLQQLYEGWMKGAAEINSSEANKRKAAKILAENFEGVDEDWAVGAINNVRLCTHGDNENFFGINREYSGVTGEKLYGRMNTVYSGLGVIEGTAPSWRLISNSSLVKGARGLNGPEQASEEAKSFTKISDKEAKTKEAVATKRVSINFRSGEYQLDPNAQNIIDREFVDIAKAFGNSRIRIEGNTDNVGNHDSNVALSRKRAQSVKTYLVNEHNVAPNRIIVIGNGPDNPVASNETAKGKAQNRRTDFELIRD
jgi:NitT/TauT family transport system substrate-binding protein